MDEIVKTLTDHIAEKAKIKKEYTIPDNLEEHFPTSIDPEERYIDTELVSDIRLKQKVEDENLNTIFRQYINELYTLTYLTSESKNISFYYKQNTLYVEYIGYKETPYYLGQYFIEFVLPNTYPNDPPSISVLTESGRFIPGKKLSLSISSYHPGTWYPQSLEMLIVNFIASFTDHLYGIGHMNKTDEEKKQYALQSREYNSLHYPELCKEFEIIHHHKDLIDGLSNDEKIAYVEKLK